MAFKINIIDTILPLAVIGGVGYFAITYGPSIMDAVAQQVMGALGQPVTVSGDATAIVSGATTTTCTTGNAQMDQMYTAMGMDLCQLTSGTTGAGGLGSLNQGLPSAWGSALKNTGGIPGQVPGVASPYAGTNYPYPQYTGATQYNATPIGTSNITCPGGVCRTYVGEVINV